MLNKPSNPFHRRASKIVSSPLISADVSRTDSQRSKASSVNEEIEKPAAVVAFQDPFDDNSRNSPHRSIRNRNISVDAGAPPFKPHNPFSTPVVSISHFSIDSSRNAPLRYFRSRRIKKGETDRPELREKDKREKWVTIIPVTGILIGFAIIGILTYVGISSVENHKYCSVLYEDFSRGLNPHIWTQEVQAGGFGNQEFEQTTGDGTNVFVKDSLLHIKPTIRNASLLEYDSITNLTADGTCTSSIPADCIVVSNITGGIIIPPVFSGRIHTKSSVSIRYGRVEVTAKMPVGDWLLPAIYMLPVNETYGTWPNSGEIDIATSRGNNYTYPSGGNNIISSTLHWGPSPEMDGWWRTNINTTALHSTYNDNFNTFSLEWSEKYLFTYVNSRLMQALYVGFSSSLFASGNFPAVDSNGDMVVNPWAKTGNFQSPFDQSFYLLINVAVGGSSGLFLNGKAGKPWVDDSVTAKRDFWNARDQWLPTWQAPGAGEMIISKVRMWQQCD